MEEGSMQSTSKGGAGSRGSIGGMAGGCRIASIENSILAGNRVRGSTAVAGLWPPPWVFEVPRSLRTRRPEGWVWAQEEKVVLLFLFGLVDEAEREDFLL